MRVLLPLLSAHRVQCRTPKLTLPPCPLLPFPPLQCAAGQLEGAGHEDEFLCTTCSAVLRNTDVFGAGALEAANALKGAAQDAASSQKRLEQAAGAQGEWVSSSKVGEGYAGGDLILI